LLRSLPCSRKSAGGVARLAQSDSYSLCRFGLTRRGKLIVLTEPGKRLIDEALSRHVANEERLLLSLSEAEQETLSALLKKLIAGL
jgi:hypothetical protein